MNHNVTKCTRLHHVDKIELKFQDKLVTFTSVHASFSHTRRKALLREIKNSNKKTLASGGFRISQEVEPIYYFGQFSQKLHEGEFVLFKLTDANVTGSVWGHCAYINHPIDGSGYAAGCI